MQQALRHSSISECSCIHDPSSRGFRNEGADATVRDIRHMISLGGRTEPGLWRPPVVKTVASQGQGIGEVVSPRVLT